MKAFLKGLAIFLLDLVRRYRKMHKSFFIYSPPLNRKIEFWKWKRQVFFPLAGIDPNFKRDRGSDIPLDVIIPTATKDFGMLETVVTNLKLNIKHPINKIFIVSKDNPEIKTFCTRHNLHFVDEFSVLGYSPDKIKYTCNEEDRSGWLYQQLLKLKGDSISDLDFFLVLDSDTVFVKPVIFIENGKRIIDFSDEYHLPYYEIYSKLLKRKHLPKVSYVTHYMLFERKKLQELRQEIEICNDNCKWDDVILQNVDYLQCSGFSEYETYANFVLSKYPGNYFISYWFNKSDVSFSGNYPDFYKTVSVHSYQR